MLDNNLNIEEDDDFFEEFKTESILKLNYEL